MSRVIQYSGSSKFDIAQLRDLNPQLLTRLRDTSNTSGELEERNALFSAMYDLWDTLKKDTDTMASAVRALTFSVAPYADEGKEPSYRAQIYAKVVEAAIWQRKTLNPGEWGHSFLEMVECMTHAMCRGVTVHEIEIARTKDLVYPAVYHPIPPQFYGWETEEGKPDRLLMYPDGQQRGNKGKPFPAHKFIIALNTKGPDHPLFNNTYQALVGWFGAAMWGKTWYLQYCNRYGKPVTVYTVPDELQAQKKRAELLANPSVTDIVKVGDQTKVEVMSAAGGASIPQAELLKMAEAACHKLILGQTLTSDTSENGGSLAQAKVHAGVQKTEEMKLGEWVCEILNAQLVPAIIAWNFGRVEGIELPEIRCAMPEAQMNMAKIEYYKALKELGVDVNKSKVYDDLGLPMPDDSVATMGWESQQEPPPGGGFPFGGNTPQGGGNNPTQGQQGGNNGNAPQNERDRRDGKDENTEAARRSGQKPVEEMTDEELEAELKEAEAMADATYGKWLSPVLEWLRKAADGKVTPEEFRDALARGEMNPDTKALVEALYEAAAKPLRGNGGGESVSAAKGDPLEKPAPLGNGKFCYTEGCSVHGTTADGKITKNADGATEQPQPQGDTAAQDAEVQQQLAANQQKKEELRAEIEEGKRAAAAIEQMLQDKTLPKVMRKEIESALNEVNRAVQEREQQLADLDAADEAARAKQEESKRAAAEAAKAAEEAAKAAAAEEAKKKAEEEAKGAEKTEVEKAKDEMINSLNGLSEILKRQHAVENKLKDPNLGAADRAALNNELAAIQKEYDEKHHAYKQLAANFDALSKAGKKSAVKKPKPKQTKAATPQTDADGVEARKALAKKLAGKTTGEFLRARVEGMGRNEAETAKINKKLAEGKGGLMEVWNASTRQERGAIKDYTGQGYDDLNQQLRDPMRGRTKLLPKQKQMADRLDAVLSRASLPKATRVLRDESGLGNNMLKSSGLITDDEFKNPDLLKKKVAKLKAQILKDGGILVEESGFSSTSVNKDSEFKIGVQRSIELKKGSKALFIDPVSRYSTTKIGGLKYAQGIPSNEDFTPQKYKPGFQPKYGQEMEVLAARGLKTYIVGMEIINGRIYTIEVEK